jgi:hypothetical protein
MDLGDAMVDEAQGAAEDEQVAGRSSTSSYGRPRSRVLPNRKVQESPIDRDTTGVGECSTRLHHVALDDRTHRALLGGAWLPMLRRYGEEGGNGSAGRAVLGLAGVSGGAAGTVWSGILACCARAWIRANEFLRTPPHVQVIASLKPYVGPTKFVTWTISAADGRPRMAGAL